MNKYLPKVLLLSIMGLLIVPQIAFAAWWNPLTWRAFNRWSKPKIQEVVASPLASSTPDRLSEIEDLKKEVGELKKKLISPTPKPKPSTTLIRPNTPEPTPRPTPVFTPAPTQFMVTPTPVPTPNQDELYRQSLNMQINNLIQQRYQQLLIQQQQQKQYNDQLSSLVQQINQIKADYYVEVENIENQTISMTTINGQISKLTQDTNKKINQLTSQYNLLLSQQGAPLNYQVSQNLTLPNTTTVWRIDGSLNGMEGTISGSNGQSYRWDCVNSTSCTLY